MSNISESYTHQRLPLFDLLAIQFRVIGAILMRELHTRYGRDNIGYLWLIGEPMMLGTVISALHSGGSHSAAGIPPVAFTIVGYCNFIMFRGVVNRAEGAMHANLPLLYHRMVTVFDIAFARALLEAAGTAASFIILYSLAILLGFALPPARPLYLFIGNIYLFLLSFGIALIIVGGTYENSFLERMVHPFTYFMIPLSGAFIQADWLAPDYRYYYLLNPYPQVFETLRYGAFQTAPIYNVDFEYMTAWAMGLLLLGLITIRGVKSRIHLG